VHEREARIGPWLVALGAALWGTETAWRVPLAKLLEHDDVLVWWEHVLLVVLALPFVIPRLGELRTVSKKTLGWLLFSGLAGSALGAVLFTLALEHGNITVINVVLNVQPVLSTTAAVLLFGDKLSRRFPWWAGLAVISGIALVGLGADRAYETDGAGVPLALLTALCWGMSTVAGRAVMVEMSLPLAAGLRVIIGLVAMTVLVAARGLLTPEHLWPAHARAATGETIGNLIALATLSGWAPLLFYFRGLALTRASTAGYFEMMQTLAAVGITWGVFGVALTWEQVIAAAGLIFAVAMVQRAQEQR
jgi:drug/metabolite transporter (DMT)-like permease